MVALSGTLLVVPLVWYIKSVRQCIMAFCFLYFGLRLVCVCSLLCLILQDAVCFSCAQNTDDSPSLILFGRLVLADA